MTTLQQQSRIRKAIYAGLIVALFTGTLFYRQQVLLPRAQALALREQDVGEADLTGAAVRLSLTGSRGVTIAILWYLANDKQMRHEWNELEILVWSIIKLQPHFARPWLFQSWNIAFNVSAECDQVKDKYFYISRGIQILAEGERQNKNHPDLRFFMGYYYHDKFGLSDESNQLRSLFQLSCIDPLEREPRRFRKADGSIDLAQFRQFCERHPTLVRRLREQLNCQTPEAVVDFLAEHRDLPTRFEAVPADLVPQPTASPLLPPEKQFPALPRRADFPAAAFAAEDRLEDDFDNYAAARVWFEYAQAPLPPPGPDPLEPPADFDRLRFRLPRTMGSAPIIFRGYPARAQSYLAERRQMEGWFDDGWEIDAGKTGASRWFAEKLVVGREPRYGSGPAWKQAAEMWAAHGRRNGLLPEPGRPLTPEQRRANLLTNFPHFYAQAQVECLPEAVAARKRFFQADAKRKAAEPDEAVRLYREGLAKWKAIFLAHPDFQKDVDIQEDAFTIQWHYLRLEQEQHGPQARQLLLAADLLGQGVRPAGVPLWLPPVNVVRPSLLPVGFVGPLDGTNRAGEPLIGPHARERGQFRLGLVGAR